MRRIGSKVAIGPHQGLPEAYVILCDNIITVPTVSLDSEPVGQLDEFSRAQLDSALRYALDIIY